MARRALWLSAALALERQRIVADLHDGLGATLLGLLLHVRSGNASAASIEERVQEALLEMRIAIDALRPQSSNIDSVLGDLRYRLSKTIAAAGIRLDWEVEKLAPVTWLNPSAVLSVQRILLEAITNSLKHSGCRRIRLKAATGENNFVEIILEDDGRGFDGVRAEAGHGLANMRMRADQIGARLEISHRSGTGTTVRLLLPARR